MVPKYITLTLLPLLNLTEDNESVKVTLFNNLNVFAKKNNFSVNLIKLNSLSAKLVTVKYSLFFILSINCFNWLRKCCNYIIYLFYLSNISIMGPLI